MKAFGPPSRLQTAMTFMGQRYKVTDLSQPISPNDPTFGGDQRVVMCDNVTHEETIRLGLTKARYSYRVVGFSICDHARTHVDAINDVGPERGTRAIGELPLEWFIAAGVWADF